MLNNLAYYFPFPLLCLWWIFIFHTSLSYYLYFLPLQKSFLCFLNCRNIIGYLRLNWVVVLLRWGILRRLFVFPAVNEVCALRCLKLVRQCYTFICGPLKKKRFFCWTFVDNNPVAPHTSSWLLLTNLPPVWDSVYVVGNHPVPWVSVCICWRKGYLHEIGQPF